MTEEKSVRRKDIVVGLGAGLGVGIFVLVSVLLLLRPGEEPEPTATPLSIETLPTATDAVEVVPATLFTAINRQGALFVWPVKLPRPDGRQLEWHRSAAEAAERAMKRWLRVTANQSISAYEMTAAIAELPEPVWPNYPFEEILRIAFRDRIVNSLDHPLVRRLRGIV